MHAAPRRISSRIPSRSFSRKVRVRSLTCTSGFSDSLIGFLIRPGIEGVGEEQPVAAREIGRRLVSGVAQGVLAHQLGPRPPAHDGGEDLGGTRGAAIHQDDHAALPEWRPGGGEVAHPVGAVHQRSQLAGGEELGHVVRGLGLAHGDAAQVDDQIALAPLAQGGGAHLRRGIGAKARDAQDGGDLDPLVGRGVTAGARPSLTWLTLTAGGVNDPRLEGRLHRRTQADHLHGDLGALRRRQRFLHLPER